MVKWLIFELKDIFRFKILTGIILPFWKENFVYFVLKCLNSHYPCLLFDLVDLKVDEIVFAISEK